MTYHPPSGAAVTSTVSAGYGRPNGDAVRQTLGDVVAGTVARNVVVGLRFASARKRPARRLDTAWRGGAATDRAPAAGWTAAGRRDEPAAPLGWGVVPRADAAVRGAYGASASADGTPARAGWRPTYAFDGTARAPFGAAPRHVQVSDIGLWNKVPKRDAVLLGPWDRAKLPAVIYDAPPQIVGGQPITPGYDPPGGTHLASVLESGYAPPAGDLIGNVEIIDPPPVVVVRSDPKPTTASWAIAILVDIKHRVRWGHGPQLGPRDPPPFEFPHGSTNEPPPVPEPQKVYVIMNQVEVVLLPDRTPIEVNSVDIEASVDAWCWSVRMELADPSQRAILKPTAAGPKVVEITINGYPWTAIIEGRDSAREHASTGGRNATVSGRSQTALLSDSYTARRTLVASETETAQQLARAEINDRVLPFDIDWAGLDWLIPGGTFSYQDMAPIDVISQIAAARGAVVQSAPSDATVLVRSRYPASPWTWSPDTADIALPLDWVASESAQQQSKPMYDAVFVIGQQNGVQARVTRRSEAGETFAQQVVDALIVSADVAAERGRVILSDRGLQDLVTVEIPLFPAGTDTGGATGLYTPLMLVDVIDPEDRYQALSVGVSIAARRGGGDGGLEVWQTVSLERHLSDAN